MKAHSYLLLTRIEDGSKELVNMGLVSEAISMPGEATYTTLVVPSAVHEDARYIAVSETPEDIAQLLGSRTKRLDKANDRST